MRFFRLTTLLLFAAAALCCDDGGGGFRDSDRDGLADCTERARVRNNAFIGHVLVDSNPGGGLGPISGGPERPGQIAAGDLDGDGDVDLLTYWRTLFPENDGEVYWHPNRLNEPSADFGAGALLLDGILTLVSMEAIDLDGDGDRDLAVVRMLDFTYPGPEFAWSENRLDEVEADFAPIRPIQDLGLEAPLFLVPHPRLADLDGDADPDLVFLGEGLMWRENRLNETTADFAPATAIDATQPPLDFDGHATILCADVDADGDPDVVFGSSPAETIGWYENRLDQAEADFAAARPIPTADAGANLLGASDLDGNGYPDLLTTTYATDPLGGCDDAALPCQVSWIPNFLGESDPGFDPPLQVVDFEAMSVAFADFDGDGDPDLVAGRFDGLGEQLLAFQNRLDRVGDAFVPLDLGGSDRTSSPSRSFADVDGDGDVDIFLTSSTAPLVGAIWLENPGTDPFDPDSDGDGYPDGDEEAAGSDPNDAESIPLP